VVIESGWFLPDMSGSNWAGMADGGNMAHSHWGVVGNSNWSSMGHSGDWDGHLMLDGLTVLLGNLLGNRVTVNSLLQVALGDRDSLRDLLGSVDTNLLGDLTAVRLDSGVARGNSSWGVHNCWGSMGNNRGSMGNIGGSNAMPQKTSSRSPGLSLGLSLPLDNAGDWSMWASTDLGGDLLALLLESD